MPRPLPDHERAAPPQRHAALRDIAGHALRCGGWEVEWPSGRVTWSDQVCDIHGVARGAEPHLDQVIGCYAPGSREKIAAAFDACARAATPYDLELELNVDGRAVWVHAAGQAERGADGAVVRVVGALQDVSDRKAAEQALAHSERRFRELADAMPHMVWTADADGHINFANRAVVELTGLDRSQVSGDDWIAIVHPDDLERTLARWGEAVRARTVFSTEYRVWCGAAGEYRWFRAMALPVMGEHGVLAWYGSSTDVNENWRASEELERAARRRLATLESISDAFFTLDRAERFTYLNQSAERLFGRARATLLGEEVAAAFPAAAYGNIFAPALEALALRRTTSLEAWSAPLERWLDVRAYPSEEGVTVYFRDVSDRRRAEDSLRVGERRLRLTLDNLLHAHLSIDAAGCILDWNRHAEQMFGWAAHEVLGARLVDTIIPPALREEHESRLAYLAQQQRRGGPPAGARIAFEQPRVRRSGEQFPVQLSILPIVLEDATIYSVSLFDLSERNQLRLFKSEQTAILESIAHGAPLEDVLGALARLVETQFGNATCSVMLLDEAGKRLHYAAVSPPAPAIRAAWDGIEIGPDAASCGTAAFTARPMLANDIATDPAWESERATALRLGVRACWSQPVLSSSGEVFGTFAVYGPAPRSPGADELEMLASSAHVASIAIARERALRSEREQAERLHLTRRAMEVCANPIAILSAQAPYAIDYLNSAFARVTGYTVDHLARAGLRVLWGDDHDQRGLLELRAALAQQRPGHGALKVRHRNGTMLWLDAYLSPVPDQDGVVRHVVAAMYDITAAKQYEAELEYQSHYDALTGLANRNLLRDRTHQAIKRAVPSRRPVWVACINLDRFKSIKDALGHEAGNQVLRAVAERLQAVLHPHDTAARIGADEFVAVLCEYGDAHAVAAQVGAIRQAIAQPLAVDGHDCFVTCRVGVAGYPSDGETADVLLDQAHLAMYRAKGERAGFQFYTPAMNDDARERLQLENDLRQALQRGELALHYQPQVDARSGCIVGAEALLRWNHPQLGMISPARFIPIAEQTGLIEPIGAWVMLTACRQAKAWQDAGLDPIRVAVNLSARQFYRPELLPSVTTILRQSGLAPQWLELELTEGLVAEDVAHAVDILHALKAVGVKLSIDDFGTGYSSLSHLKNFPIDVLKVDQSFVRNIASDPGQATIARTIIALGHSLGLQVVAEGVETAEQLGYLRRHRCDQIQGYYFSRPVPAHEFRQLLQANTFAEQARRAGGDQPRQTLLVVDDEPDMTGALELLLEGKGYRILRAHSAEEGLSLLAQHDIQVILSDHLMPGISGTEFLARAKQLYPDTVALMLSGYTSVEEIIAATNSGAVFRFHSKPWDSAALCKSIGDAFRYYWSALRADA